jgi:NADH-quinone oxidoreductase subunit H
MISKLAQVFVYPGILYMVALAFFLEWLDRKLVARLQNRVGPHYAGPYGLLQPLADFVKLLTKESIVPSGADGLLFTLCPVTAFIVVATAASFVPMTSTRGLLSTEGDAVAVLALITIYLLLVYTAGAASPSRYSLVGAVRAAHMLLGFELPLMLSCLGVIASAGSFKLSEIAAQGVWRVFGLHALGFAIFLVAAEAELDRLPFDIPEAEQEIVSGWLVEYSSWRLALLRLTKDMELLLLSGLATTLFLGGPAGPAPPSAENLLYPLYFLAKTAFVVFLLSLIRASSARIRLDQFVVLCWRYLVPASFAYLALAVWVV